VPLRPADAGGGRKGEGPVGAGHNRSAAAATVVVSGGKKRERGGGGRRGRMEDGGEGGGRRASPVSSPRLQATPSPGAPPPTLEGKGERERRRRAAVARRSRPSPSRSPLVAAPGGVLPALSASGEVGLLERSGGREREGKSREFFLMYTVYNRGFILERRLRNPTVEKIWRDVATLAARGAPAECICKMPCLDFFLHLDIIVLSLYLIIISLL
jgi:hypothetical protein